MADPIETQPTARKIVPPPPIPVRQQKTQVRTDRQFSIKRTKSEIGYVYWILEGYGKNKCFVLCDSWDEAMEQAEARLRSSREESQEYIFADGL